MTVLEEAFLSVYYKFPLVVDKPVQVILKTACNTANITESDLALTELLTHAEKHSQKHVFRIPCPDTVNQESSESPSCT